MEISEIATKQQLDSIMSTLNAINRRIEELNAAINANAQTPTRGWAVYNLGEAARILGISRSTLDRRIASGQIRTNAANQIPASEIEQYASPRKANQTAGSRVPK